MRFDHDWILPRQLVYWGEGGKTDQPNQSLFLAIPRSNRMTSVSCPSIKVPMLPAVGCPCTHERYTRKSPVLSSYIYIIYFPILLNLTEPIGSVFPCSAPWNWFYYTYQIETLSIIWVMKQQRCSAITYGWRDRHKPNPLLLVAGLRWIPLSLATRIGRERFQSVCFPSSVRTSIAAPEPAAWPIGNLSRIRICVLSFIPDLEIDPVVMSMLAESIFLHFPSDLNE